MTKYNPFYSTNDCPMCGRKANRLVARWYKKDNNTQELTFVCTACAEEHARAIKKGRKNA